MEKLFWSQFSASKRPLLLNEQMSQWAELHRIFGAAMKNIITRLWPTEPVSNSYFSLVQRLVDAVPRIDDVKRSVCIEGARMAFACAKMHWPKMDAMTLMTEGPPKGKEHRQPEKYYDSVLKGSRLVAEQCAKDVTFE